MGTRGHLTMRIAPNVVSQFLGSQQSPPSTPPPSCNRVLDSFFLSLLPTRAF